MGPRILLTFTVFGAAMLLSSCTVTSYEHYDHNVEISYDEFCESNHRSGELEVEVGDKIRMELCSDPATGYKWDYETTEGNVLREEEHSFMEPEEDFSGTSGMEVWTFEAVENGTTELRMEYSPRWEGDVWKAEWTYTLTVIVK